MKKADALKELPDTYTIPNSCEYCKVFIGFWSPSSIKWATDGTSEGTFGFCSKKCRSSFLKERKKK